MTQVQNLCEACQAQHDSSYASGRFCSAKCSRSFATRSKRAEINAKVSASLKSKPTRKSYTWKLSEDQRADVYKRIGEKISATYEAKPFNELGDAVRRRRILAEQHGLCACCNIPQIWNERPLRFELDHEDGDRLNNSRANLRLLCPNCHSQTPTWGSRNAKGEARAKMLNGNWGSRKGKHRRESNSCL